MPKHTLTKPKYSKLLKDVRKLIEEGKAKAEQAAGQELVLTYWGVGQRISEEEIAEGAGYMRAVVSDLADELGVEVTTLRRAVQFFQTYKRAPRGANLNWSHYKLLLPIANEEKREWYEELAQEKSLTRAQLESAIRGEKFEEFEGRKRGKKKKVALKRPTKPSYLYKAEVIRVIDGDTLLLRIDLGFTTFKEQRVRLAEIDTPPLDSKKGEEAYKFVLHKLAESQSVVVKTNKIDIYGRYVGHVFYATGKQGLDTTFLAGKYLNAELVSSGLATLI